MQRNGSLMEKGAKGKGKGESGREGVQSTYIRLAGNVSRDGMKEGGGALKPPSPSSGGGICCNIPLRLVHFSPSEELRLCLSVGRLTGRSVLSSKGPIALEARRI